MVSSDGADVGWWVLREDHSYIYIYIYIQTQTQIFPSGLVCNWSWFYLGARRPVAIEQLSNFTYYVLAREPGVGLTGGTGESGQRGRYPEGTSSLMVTTTPA